MHYFFYVQAIKQYILNTLYFYQNVVEKPTLTDIHGGSFNVQMFSYMYFMRFYSFFWMYVPHPITLFKAVYLGEEELSQEVLVLLRIGGPVIVVIP